MEQDVEEHIIANVTVCSCCLSRGRNLISINNNPLVFEVFKVLMSDFSEEIIDIYGERHLLDQYVCWECVSIMKKFSKFKVQVHNAQKHMQIVSLSSGQQVVDHSYLPQSLSSLDSVTKCEYDRIMFDYSENPLDDDWSDEQYMVTTESTLDNVKPERLDVAQTMRESIQLHPMHTHIVDDMVIQNPVVPNVAHILIREVDALGTNFILEESQSGHFDISTENSMKEYSTLEISGGEIGKMTLVKSKTEEPAKCAYTLEFMTEEDMLASREAAKNKVHYASAVYKCELCIIGFYNQQQVQEHFLAYHRSKPGKAACKVCYVYIDERKLGSHVDQHYFRYNCKMCTHVEYSDKLMSHHVKTHMDHSVPNSIIKIGDLGPKPTRGRRRKEIKHEIKQEDQCKPGDLRKLLSKKTIEGYQCLECDMFFKNSRARKNHVLRYHREGLQCDVCKKKFVNRTTLATHLRLHDGPLPRDECPICHKQVRVIQLKYHIRRHQTKGAYECSDCKKVFSHVATYQAHLKYSRAHASDDVFKFPCPMCNKGYPTKELMQDHFNYQHLGKTAHKCPICDKPIASRLNVEKHMLRVHAEKKEKPRNHVCLQCGKAFTDRKALNQHEVIHSGDRPLVCDICHQTFKQKASLYTHRKRVHKVFPSKKVVEFMENNKS